jgi:acyl-[acyl-carrier-protein]-phospholipid O-acyltransferase / long-chain-fatty-acid--[acyl-carrier-protein] ligase
MKASSIRWLPRQLIRWVGGLIVRSVYRIQRVHPERVPAQGGALLLPNHVTFADGFFLSVACSRPIRFVMDETFMARRSIRWFVTIFDTVAIRRDQPREAIRVTIEALKNGDLICLFPEGQLTRTGALSELRRGFELIAKKAGHPLIPIWCDGAWGSIFSFERGRFFRKWPREFPFRLTVAFGREISPVNGGRETVRHGLLVCSAAALDRRFEQSGWGRKIPKSCCDGLANFRQFGEFERRRFWMNGYQIGQVNALQRRLPFFVLSHDPVPSGIPAISLTFSALFGAHLTKCDSVAGDHAASWVGGDELRTALGQTQIVRKIVFYDFGDRALEPICRAGLEHCPCLAVEGMVIAMSMPHPPKPMNDSEPQLGHKLGTWGKLLPGWYLLPTKGGSLRVHGPAASKEGLVLPAQCYLDAEGFLASAKAR